MSGDNKATPKASLHPVYTVSNIQHKVRVLDGVKVSYASWVSLFTLHARGHKVLSHIDGTAAPTKTDPEYADWCEIDAHVLQWIYGTVSDDLLPRVLLDPSTAYEAWKRVEAIFRNNKGARAATLEHEFNNLKLESMPSLDAYCQRLRDLAAQLKGVDAEIDDARLVRQMVRGLPAEYDVVAAYINQTMPSFETARDMLDLEQNRKIAREGSSSALTVTSAQPQTWGDTSVPTTTSPAPRNSGRETRNNNRRRDNRGSQKKAAQSQPRAATTPVSATASWPNQPPWPYQWTPPPCPYPTFPGWAPTWPQWQAPAARPRSGFTPRTAGHAHLVDNASQQPTDLGQAFQALSIQAPSDGQWFMDTGASSHLTSDAGPSDWDYDSEE